LEGAIDDDLANSQHLIVELKKGTLADVLDEIVRQKPSYTWEISDNTIKVFPRSEARDPVLHALLDTKISRFVIRNPTPKYTFRDTLSRLPELESLLTSNGVPPTKHFLVTIRGRLAEIFQWTSPTPRFDQYWIMLSRIVRQSIGLLIAMERIGSIC